VDKSFIAQAMCFLMPVVLGCVVFSFLNLNTYGFPNYSYDAMGTHYKAQIQGYSPVLPVINTLARWGLGEALYPFWFICLNLAVFIIIPYILLFEITKKHRYGIVFLYGTAIPVLGYITCLLGQALVVDLMLLLIARPKWVWGVALIATFSHIFGLVAIVLTKLWVWYDARNFVLQN